MNWKKHTVEATALDAPGEFTGVSFFEVAEDAGDQSYFVVIAPHGGMIEKPTDEQAAAVTAVPDRGISGIDVGMQRIW